MLSWACTRPTDLDFPQHQSRLVLHGFTAVGDTFKVSLDLTLSFEEPVPIIPNYIRDAVVLLYEDGQLRDTLKYNLQEERYISSFVKAVSGRSYKVEALVQGHEKVEAVALAPQAVPVRSLTRSRSTRNIFTGTPLDDIKFTIADPAGPNFYLATLNYIGGSFCVYTSDPAIERYTQDVVPFDQSSCINNNELLFTDKSFNGTVRELTVSAESDHMKTFTDNNGNARRPYLKLYHINEDFYRYLRDGANSDFNDDLLTISEPVRVKGNVKGGYGLFTVFTATTDTIP